MNILKKYLRNGEIKFQIASEEDLWHLSHIINGTDLVKGSTERKVKIGDETNFKVVRKHVFLVLEVEKVEYEPENNALRVLGRIKEGPDDVSIGSYHSFSLEINDTISIVKDEWPNYLLQRLNDSLKASSLSSVSSPSPASRNGLSSSSSCILSSSCKTGSSRRADLKMTAGSSRVSSFILVLSVCFSIILPQFCFGTVELKIFSQIHLPCIRIAGQKFG